MRRRRRRTALIKSNNPHLAGGEKNATKKQNPVEAKKSQHDTKLALPVRESDGNDPARHRNSFGF